MKLQKRLYKSATVTGTGPFGIALDGRPLKTPYKHPLVLENAQVAEVIADEWQAQGAFILPKLMTFTSLAFTAVDHVAGARAQTIDDIASYAASDLVCYRAEEPAGLVDRQAAHWDPILATVREILGAQFLITQGITFKRQPADALSAVAGDLERKSPFQLAAIRYLIFPTGSALIPLVLAHGRLATDAAWAAAHVDEDWQIEQWGQDAEAKAIRKLRRRQFCEAVEFLRLESFA